VRVIGKLNLSRPEVVPAPETTPAPASDADVTERLMLEFELVHGLRFLSEIIRMCRHELRGTVNAGPGRSLDVLARERLAAL
jgi:hypothetical protein